jgi:hypothetical protein
MSITYRHGNVCGICIYITKPSLQNVNSSSQTEEQNMIRIVSQCGVVVFIRDQFPFYTHDTTLVPGCLSLHSDYTSGWTTEESGFDPRQGQETVSLLCTIQTDFEVQMASSPVSIGDAFSRGTAAGA